MHEFTNNNVYYDKLTLSKHNQGRYLQNIRNWEIIDTIICLIFNQVIWIIILEKYNKLLLKNVLKF